MKLRAGKCLLFTGLSMMFTGLSMNSKHENESESDEWFALYPCLCYTEQKVLMKT